MVLRYFPLYTYHNITNFVPNCILLFYSFFYLRSKKTWTLTKRFAHQLILENMIHETISWILQPIKYIFTARKLVRCCYIFNFYILYDDWIFETMKLVFSILTSSNFKNPLLNLVGFFHSLSFCLFTTNLNSQPYPKPLKLLQWFKGFISLLLNFLENKYLVQLNLSLPRYHEQLFTTTTLWSYKPKKLLQTIPKII